MVLLEVELTSLGMVFVLFKVIEDFDHLIQIVKICGLIERERHMVAVNLSDVYSILMELGQEVIRGAKSRRLNINTNCIEVVLSVSSELDTDDLKSFHENLRHESSFNGHFFETISSMPLHVEGSHISKKGLSSAKVACSLVSSDVLLSSL